MDESIIARFWAKVDRRGPDECWPWLAAKTNDGYGQIRVAGVLCRAPRISFELFYAKRPGAAHVRHTCDNPPCCNPRHLELGTNGDNVADRQRRGRSARGPRNGRTLLTEAGVSAIRLDAGRTPPKALAAQYGVSRDVIYQVLHRRAWRHVE